MLSRYRLRARKHSAREIGRPGARPAGTDPLRRARGTVTATRTRRGRAATVWVMVLSVAASTAACGSAGTKAGPGNTQPTVSSTGTGSSTTGSGAPGSPSTGASAGSVQTGPATTPPTSATHTPSAADQLTTFFAAATRADTQLRHSATLVNRGITSTQVAIAPAAVKAVQAIDTHSVVRAIPGGLPAGLEKSLLQVYADLASRQAAFNRIEEYAGRSPLSRSTFEGRDLVNCLGNGAKAATWFPGDLAAARKLAAATPRQTLPAESSRQGAEVAIHAHFILLGNSGCDSCGGFVPRPVPLYKIVWKRIVESYDPHMVWDGTVGESGRFRARYTAAEGWDIGVNAC
jgi:hypothetical protein